MFAFKGPSCGRGQRFGCSWQWTGGGVDLKSVSLSNHHHLLMIIIMITMIIVIMMIMIRWESFYQVSTFASDKSQSNRSLPSPFITFILSSPLHVVIIQVAMMMLVTVLTMMLVTVLMMMMMVTMIKDCFKREQVSYVGVCGQMHGCVLWKVTLSLFFFSILLFLIFPNLQKSEYPSCGRFSLSLLLLFLPDPGVPGVRSMGPGFIQRCTYCKCSTYKSKDSIFIEETLQESQNCIDITIWSNHGSHICMFVNGNCWISPSVAV